MTSEQTQAGNEFVASDLIGGDRGASDDDGGPGAGGTAPAIAADAAERYARTVWSDVMPSMCVRTTCLTFMNLTVDELQDGAG